MSTSAPDLLLANFFRAYAAQDLAKLMALCEADVCHVLYLPEAISPYGGARHGKAAVRERLAEFMAEFAILKLEPYQTLADKSRAVVRLRVHMSHRETGAALITETAQFFQFADGVIADWAEFQDVEPWLTFISDAAKAAARAPRG